eukprot:4228268-Pleurochrysis_carterae.AAC.10
MRAFLSARFGKQGANIVTVLKLWESYGQLSTRRGAIHGSRARIPIVRNRQCNFFEQESPPIHTLFTSFRMSLVPWMPLVKVMRHTPACKIVYNYVDRRSGQAVRRSQGFLLSCFARPENLRLGQHLRFCKLKRELDDDVSIADAAPMLEATKNKRITARAVPTA